MGFQQINVAIFQDIEFFTTDIKISEIFLIWMWCKCIYHICVCTKNVNVPYRFTNIDYVGAQLPIINWAPT
jgi:hypothetical protein